MVSGWHAFEKDDGGYDKNVGEWKRRTKVESGKRREESGRYEESKY
jgi:hypothetical protein